MDLERLRERIREIARDRKNVRFDELCTLLDNHIAPMFDNYNHHHASSHHAFTIGRETFTVAKPHRGPTLRAAYVTNFLRAMEANGLYDPEEGRDAQR